MIPIVVAVSIAVIIAGGCATDSHSKAATGNGDSTSIDGAWSGVEITHGNEGPATLTISGQTLEFHGHEDDDWIKGTFSVREDVNPKQLIGVITACDDPNGIGKKCYAIYKIDDGTLTIAGNAPGESDFPSDFGAEGAREFVFKRGQ